MVKKTAAGSRWPRRARCPLPPVAVSLLIKAPVRKRIDPPSVNLVVPLLVMPGDIINVKIAVAAGCAEVWHRAR